MASDTVTLYKDVYVKVVAETNVLERSSAGIGNAKYLFASTLFPGAGLNLKTRSGKPYYLMGVAGYLGVASTLYFDQLKRNAYRDWHLETDAGKKDALYEDYLENRKYMIVSATTTGTLWLVNLVWTMVAPQAERMEISLGKEKGLHLGTTIVGRNFTPGFSLTCHF